MEVCKCSRCGVFYVGNGYFCTKCINKENFEISQFKNYIEENNIDLSSLSNISEQTGISEKNINRFFNYDEFKK